MEYDRPPSPEEFQRLVLGILGSRWPDREFRPGRDVFEVVADSQRISLQSLYAQYATVPGSVGELPTTMQGVLGDLIRPVEDALEWTWEQASQVVRPLITAKPRFAGLTVPPVTFPFPGGLTIAIVRDEDTRYAYLTEREREAWQVSRPELLKTALSNLDEVSRGLPFAAAGGNDAVLILRTGDGYDAARVLLQRVRRFAASHLGEPFLAGIPNRDFLVLWSRACAPKVQEAIRYQLVEDHRQQPYAITANVLRVSRERIELESEPAGE